MVEKICYLIISFTLLSCNVDSDLFSDYSSENENNVNDINKITDTKAIILSNLFLKRETSRFGQFTIPNCQAITFPSKTRSGETDTIAYAVNYPDNNGFTLVSSNNKVFPILAFSETGNIDITNEDVYSHFISRLPSYINENCGSATYDDGDVRRVACIEREPCIEIKSIHQRAPWNRYVVVDHPSCPAGCGAIALTNIYIHAVAYLKYHNVYYPFKSMVKAIRNRTAPLDISPKRISGVNPDLPEYSYEQAKDSIAKLIYIIGKDINTRYTKSASYSRIDSLLILTKQLGFTVPSNGLKLYNFKTVSELIRDNYMILLSGVNSSDEGHALVADGCYFCYDPFDDTRLINAYIHCNWGWSGNCNGYYTGDVFENENGTFAMEQYFAVKRDPFLTYD